MALLLYIILYLGLNGLVIWNYYPTPYFEFFLRLSTAIPLILILISAESFKKRTTIYAVLITLWMTFGHAAVVLPFRNGGGWLFGGYLVLFAKLIILEFVKRRLKSVEYSPKIFFFVFVLPMLAALGYAVLYFEPLIGDHLVVPSMLIISVDALLLGYVIYYCFISKELSIFPFLVVCLVLLSDIFAGQIYAENTGYPFEKYAFVVNIFTRLFIVATFIQDVFGKTILGNAAFKNQEKLHT